MANIQISPATAGPQTSPAVPASTNALTNHNPVTSTDWSLQTYVLYGTGQVGTTVGDGNRDTMLYSDGTHPTTVGQTQWAAQIATEIRADILNYASGGAIRVA